jgi:hypothetical protein
MIVVNCEQNSTPWLEARLGKPTASCFDQIITSTGELTKSTKGGKPPREKYMLKLAAVRVTGRITEGYTNANMERGHEQEQEASDYYAMVNGVELEKIGFILDDSSSYGCSPDRRMAIKNGGLEIKTAFPHVQAERLYSGWTGSDHHRQIMGCMLLTDAEWWDLMSYCPGMRDVTIRFYRDERFLDKLKRELEIFCEELDEMVKRIS